MFVLVHGFISHTPPPSTPKGKYIVNNIKMVLTTGSKNRNIEKEVSKENRELVLRCLS